VKQEITSIGAGSYIVINLFKRSCIMRKSGKKIAGAIAAGTMAVAGAAGSASAAVDLTAVTLDTTSPETLAATVLTGLGVIWGIRKLIKLINRS
jgi:hypothetical protein